jgi:hypothetical protein
MKKLESFLSINAWLLKIGVFFLFPIWVTGLYAPLFHAFAENAPTYWKHVNERDFKKDLATREALVKILQKKIQTAKDKGIGYGPKEYYADLKELYEKESESPEGAPPLFITDIQNQLQDRMLDNLRKGYYTSEDAEKYQGSVPVGIMRDKRIKGWADTLTWNDVPPWLLGVYFRGLLLSLLLFITRMSERGGILETILADKRKFLLSTAIWPAFIVKYPHNVVREIIVEAELRRMGDFFRRFKPEEKQLAREVAASGRYKEWLSGFHREHRLDFRRSLLLTLIPAILLYFFLPMQQASAGKARGDPTSLGSASLNYDNAKKGADNGINKDDHRPTVDKEAVLANEKTIFQDFFVRLKVVGINLIRETSPRDIDHIPLFGFLVTGINTVPNTG